MERQGTSWPQALSRVWAKSGDATGWLSLQQHMIDSSNVAGYLWNDWLAESTKRQLAIECGLSQQEVLGLVRFIAGSHDVGKADPLFIGQLADRADSAYLVDVARQAGLTFPASLLKPVRIPHSHLSEVIIAEYLKDRSGMTKVTANTYAAISGSHHGLPVAQGEQRTARSHLDELYAQAPEWRELHAPALDALADYTDVSALLPRLSNTTLPVTAQMILTGLIIMADWIASNTEACPLSPEGISTDPDRARRAMNYVELTPPWQAAPLQNPTQAYRERFSWPPSRVPRPLQLEAPSLVNEADDSDNALLVVEAPMGMGKTELALLCAEQLAQRYDCSGIMVAAPTMATANGLFRRVTQWAQQSMKTEPASLFLAHSKSFLNEEYRKFTPGYIGDAHASDYLYAHQWLSGRKKGMLANAVVGTIDQVLLMALQSKHMMLRHLGLAQKVVIIDEVHAVDAYMANYLKRALTWFGRYNTPVILLSATLPGQLRSELITAYTTGRITPPRQAPASAVDDRYPVLTMASTGGILMRHPDAGMLPTSVSIAPINDDDESLRAALQDTVRTGGCTAVICSTVDRAQQAYATAKDLVGKDAVLLHSRFTANQRATQERELLDVLGPGATRANGQRPKRKIIVATQVIEQSLDIDVDFMITDIAPSDLVLQRSGRLHRHQRASHERPAWASVPRVLVRGFSTLPTPENVGFDDLVKLIYPEALLMSSTVALGLLESDRSITVPEQIPIIVRETYDFENIPEAWRVSFTPAHRTLQAQRKKSTLSSGAFLLKSPSQETLSALFGNNAGDIGNDSAAEQRGLAQVRDSEASIEVILIQDTGTGYRVLPWLGGQATDSEITDEFAPSWEQQQILAASTVQLPRTLAYNSVIEDTINQLLQETPVGWQQTYQLKDQLALRLDEQLRCRIGNKLLEYSPELGLRDLSRQDNATRRN